MREERSIVWQRGSGLAVVCGLLFLAGCIPPGGVQKESPDATLDFDQGWKAASTCAQAKLADAFPQAKLKNHDKERFAEITVAGNYSLSTIMVIDVQDVSPGKARAAIHSHDYMLIWGGPTDRAVQAMAACNKTAS